MTLVYSKTVVSGVTVSKQATSLPVAGTTAITKAEYDAITILDNFGAGGDEDPGDGGDLGGGGFNGNPV